jgi:CheY-like chemotaxis protein
VDEFTRQFQTSHAPGVAVSCLIVDDNIDYLQTARTLLEREGLDVVGLATGSAEALQRVSELRPSVVLVDIYLGEASGLDLTWQWPVSQMVLGPR